MKIVVDSIPDSPNECLFCTNTYEDICGIKDCYCFISSRYKERICPYLIELKDVK